MLTYIQNSKAAPHDITSVRASDVGAAMVNTPLEVSTSYRNGTGVPVTVVLRTGLTALLPPQYERGSRNFTVTYRVTLAGEVNLDIFRLSNALTPEAQLLKDALEYGHVKHRRGQKIAEITYDVTREEIQEKGGSLYLKNLDVVLSVLQGDLVPLHPYSEVGIRNRLVAENDSINNVGSFGYALQIVDNASVFGDRYININNQIYKVPVMRDPERPDGVYRVSSPSVKGDYALAPPESLYFRFDEVDAANLGLWRTYEEALTLGDVLAAKKQELESLALEIKREEAVLKREKQEREAAFEARKHKYEELRLQADDERKRQEQSFKITENRMLERQTRLKDEISELEHKRQITSMHQKDHYELRAYERKDSSEYLKLIPTFIAGVDACFLAVKKFT